MALDERLASLAFCYVETTGRVSGRPHLVEMWFASDPVRVRVYLLSGGRDDSDWVLNLRNEPRVRVRLDGRWYEAAAEEIEGRADEPLARRLLAAKYQGWTEGRPLSGWARHSLPVAIDLEG